MTKKPKVHCILCEKEIDLYGWSLNSDIIQNIHPSGAVHFIARGHYGTTVFDPMNGTSLEIAICDECVIKKKDFIYGNGKGDLN